MLSYGCQLDTGVESAAWSERLSWLEEIVVVQDLESPSGVEESSNISQADHYLVVVCTNKGRVTSAL